jgi:hypothetical protein
LNVENLAKRHEKVKRRRRMTKRPKHIRVKDVSGIGTIRIMLRADDAGIFAKQLGASAVRAKSKASLPPALSHALLWKSVPIAKVGTV